MNRTVKSLLARTALRKTNRPMRARLKLESLEAREVPATFFAVGTDVGGGQVKIFDSATRALKQTVNPFGNTYIGGVRLAVADVTGDGISDLIAAMASGNRVRVYNGVNFRPLNGTLGNFTAFSTTESNGVFVAAGDVNNDGRADIVVGSDGPNSAKVKVFSGANGQLIQDLDVSDLNAVNGVRVAAGDVTGDGRADIVVTGGAGSSSRICVIDSSNWSKTWDFFAFDAANRAGVHLAVGDVSGDGYADIVTGGGDSGWVKVFSGKDSSSFSNLEVFPAHSGGVRVGVVDADQDGRLDIIAAQGPSGGQVRLLAAAKGMQATAAPLATLTPFPTFLGGTFVAGDSRSAGGGGGMSLLSDPPEVEITDVIHTIEGLNQPFVAGFTITRTGDLSELCYVRYNLGGTATYGQDYTTPSSITFGPGISTVGFAIDSSAPYNDTLLEPTETVTLTLLPSDGSPSSNYVLGDEIVRALILVDNDAPPPNIPAPCGCGGNVVETGPGVPVGAVDSENLVDGNLADGNIAVGATDLLSIGFGGEMGYDRRYVVHPGYNSNEIAGARTILTGMPYMLRNPTPDYPGPMAVVAGTDTLFFDGTTPRHYRGESLNYYIVEQGYMLKDAYKVGDTAGNVTHFWAWGNGIPSAQRGQFKSRTDADGNTIDATYDSSGVLTELTRTGTSGGQTVTESLLLSYSSGKVATATLRRKVGAGSWSTIQSTAYTYSNGNLTLAELKDAAGTVIDRWYYRYNVNDLLSYAFGPDSYEQLTAAYPDPTGATDTQVGPYAELFLQYDYLRRVTWVGKQGNGASSSGGIGETELDYYTSPFADGYNTWRTRVQETLPDGNLRINYLNFAGQSILTIERDFTTEQEWKTAREFDSAGRLLQTATAGAVTGYDPTIGNLGLTFTTKVIETTSYYTSTTATASTPGGVAGRVYQTFIKRGASGTPILQSTMQYFSRTDGSITIYPVANVTQYRNTDGTGGQTTSYAYTWFSGTIQPESVTTTLPVVTTAQNGSGSANSSVFVSDARGRTIWEKDEAGYINYYEYDDVTGGTLKTIRDVDTTQTSTFSNLPSGWSTPSGGGLHLTSTFVPLPKTLAV
jgi:hypothetical protein